MGGGVGGNFDDGYLELYCEAVKFEREKHQYEPALKYIYTSFPHLILLTYLLTYFTPWSRVLLEKLAGLQLVKKFSAFYGTRRLITALTSARHLSLS